MTSTITFPSLDTAKQLAIAWSRHTLRGHSLSATLPDGTAKLDAEIAKLNG